MCRSFQRHWIDCTYDNLSSVAPSIVEAFFILRKSYYSILLTIGGCWLECSLTCVRTLLVLRLDLTQSFTLSFQCSTTFIFDSWSECPFSRQKTLFFEYQEDWFAFIEKVDGPWEKEGLSLSHDHLPAYYFDPCVYCCVHRLPSI